ncbi:hypothetical protein B0I33_105336 [Prauserella shujinwangii]|uniref:Excreted virulence factor EspC (Type VII ESX diderm) n=1 Tax=Prauserella shujinwangii TaxID=1453103 RepID=A0A2T0LVA2_9PSEU|nr:hypothetical protein [Prauserella shujinwangii]PRX47754.1 hypothetical protein B0I33_105336 [Prauserella shujinwangii]
MNGYTARLGELRSAASASRSAAEQVTGVDLAAALAGAGEAMPGARSVRSFETLGDAWRADLDDWVRRAQRFADGLDVAADSYRRDDDQVAEDLGAGTGRGRAE